MNERQTQSPYLDYLQLPKEITSVDPETLLAAATAHETEYNDAESIMLKAKYASLISSCYAEAAISFHDPQHDFDDDRLLLIDEAEQWAETATTLQFDTLEGGMRHPDDQEEWLRAQLQEIFMGSYRDIVCGEVTEQTQSETLEKMQVLQMYSERLARSRHTLRKHAEPLRGLIGELKVLASFWNPRITSRQALHDVAIPSTFRGGNGRRRSTDTHDIALLHQTEIGEPFTLSGTYEVKTHGSLKRNPQALGRYTAHLLSVGRNGIHDFGPLMADESKPQQNKMSA